MNATTTLHYTYRDTHNYRLYGRVTFAGTITPDQTARFKAHLLRGRHFVPAQIGVPDLLQQTPRRYEDDAAWRHEFLAIEVSTISPDDPRTIAEFIDAVTATVWEADPGEQELTALTHSHQKDLADALHHVRSRVPHAAQVELQTSDQGTYGFTLHDVVLTSGDRLSVTATRLLEELQIESWLPLANIDWDGIVGEDKHGHTVINL